MDIDYQEFVSDLPDHFMPVFNPENFDFDCEWNVGPNVDLDWKRAVELSRKYGGTTFYEGRVKMHDIDHHGEVYSGPINWFFVFSENHAVTSMDDNIRRYHVVCFTPTCRILHAHDPDEPYQDTGLRLVFEDKDKALKIAKGLAKRNLDPRDWKWY